MGERKIKYGFEFEDNTFFVYNLNLDSDSNMYIPKGMVGPADWAHLEFNKCENCPLSFSEHKYCPVAKNLHEVVELTKDKISYQKARVVVQTQERSYCKETSLQEGLFSLFGAIMATSGCPHLDWLRPLVRFHLPFASVEETLFRSVTMYLLRQYLRSKRGAEFDTQLKGLFKNYAEVEKVNQGILKRINSFARGDADKNALVTLNIFAQMFACEWENNFELLGHIFDDLDHFEKKVS